jgi:colanic acid biosynthesis glycosyl transferase WcaI
MRVLLINRYFHPDHSPTSVLASDLAFALRQRGIQVTIITSRLRYEDGNPPLPKHETIQGVEVHRVWTSRRGRSGLLGRGLDYGTFYLAAAWRLWRLLHPDDIVIAKTDPPLLPVMAGLVTRLKGARIVNWLQDIFPEVAETLQIGGSAGGACFSMLKPLSHWSLRQANANVVVGEAMSAHLKRQGVAPGRLHVINNWADGAVVTPVSAARNELRRSWGLHDRFVVAYAGNLGRAHDVATVIEAMTLLHERAARSTSSDVARRIMFVFVGGGFRRTELEQQVLQRQLTNVRMYPYQSQDRLAETLGVADVHLVSLDPKLEGLIVPSKFYAIAAASRPTLFIGASNGEIARLINQAACGRTVKPGDGEALMDHILHLAADPRLCASMGTQARAAFDTRWDKSLAVEQWVTVLNNVTPRGPETRKSGKTQTRSATRHHFTR